MYINVFIGGSYMNFSILLRIYAHAFEYSVKSNMLALFHRIFIFNLGVNERLACARRHHA